MVDYLNLLAENAYQDLGVTDVGDWTALDSAAAFGRSSDVLWLLKFRADPRQTAQPLCWNALHHGVFYGNYETFKTLLPYFREDAASMTDLRGWTLLHIAASAGHKEIVCDLLELGADPVALSKPFMSHIPESIFNLACTPRQVAAAQNEEKERLFLEALDELCLTLQTPEENRTVDSEEEEFWEAESGLQSI